MGHLSPDRGTAEMIELAGLLRPRGVTVELIGPADARARAQIEPARSAGLLRWRGFVPNDEAMPMLDGALALSLLHDEPNFRHSMPTKVVEYMAPGVPVVTTPLPVAAELASGHECGFVVPFGDPVAAADAVLELDRDFSLRAKMGRRGHEAGFLARLAVGCLGICRPAGIVGQIRKRRGMKLRFHSVRRIHISFALPFPFIVALRWARTSPGGDARLPGRAMVRGRLVRVPGRGAAAEPNPSKTTGYSVFLHVLEPFHSLTLVAGLQHLMGLAVAVMIYLLLRRNGVSQRWATAATLPVLLDGFVIENEHMVMAEALFTFLVMLPMLLILWRGTYSRRVPWPVALLAGRAGRVRRRRAQRRAAGAAHVPGRVPSAACVNGAGAGATGAPGWRARPWPLAARCRWRVRGVVRILVGRVHAEPGRGVLPVGPGVLVRRMLRDQAASQRAGDLPVRVIVQPDAPL